MPIKLDKYGNEKSNSKTPSHFVKAKKLVDVPSKAEKTLTKAVKRKGRPKGYKVPKHVLWLTKTIYITTDKTCYHVCVVNEKADKKTFILSTLLIFKMPSNWQLSMELKFLWMYRNFQISLIVFMSLSWKEFLLV